MCLYWIEGSPAREAAVLAWPTYSAQLPSLAQRQYRLPYPKFIQFSAQASAATLSDELNYSTSFVVLFCIIILYNHFYNRMGAAKLQIISMMFALL